MRRFLAPRLLLVLLLAAPAAAAAGVFVAKQPSPGVMGIRLGMSKADAHRLLKRMGSLEREERKRQEVWAVGDRRVSHLLVGFDKELRVRYVTAIARADGPRIAYDEVADTKRARHEGVGSHHTYTWDVRARRGQPAYIMTAQGRDPRYLDSYSVKATGETEEEEEEGKARKTRNED